MASIIDIEKVMKIFKQTVLDIDILDEVDTNLENKIKETSFSYLEQFDINKEICMAIGCEEYFLEQP